MHTLKDKILTIFLSCLMSTIFLSCGYFGLHYGYEHYILYKSNSFEIFNILRQSDVTDRTIGFETFMLFLCGFFGIFVLLILTYMAKEKIVKIILLSALFIVSSLLVLTYKSPNEVQYEVMNKAYSTLESTYKFKSSNSGIFMEKAIQDKDIELFYKTINTKDYALTRQKDRIKILSIVEQLFPELKSQVISYTDDNYFSVYEYNELKKSILAAAANKKLTPNESVLLGDIK